MRARVKNGFGFTSDWLKKWREIFKPITERTERKTKANKIFTLDTIENRSYNIFDCRTTFSTNRTRFTFAWSFKLVDWTLCVLCAQRINYFGFGFTTFNGTSIFLN